VTDEASNLILEHLRAFRADMTADMQQVKGRLNAVERNVASLRLEFGSVREEIHLLRNDIAHVGESVVAQWTEHDARSKKLEDVLARLTEIERLVLHKDAE
jgi:septal ring factor EnvC (AmiA/AmiB activator)